MIYFIASLPGYHQFFILPLNMGKLFVASTSIRAFVYVAPSYVTNIDLLRESGKSRLKTQGFFSSYREGIPELCRYSLSIRLINTSHDSGRAGGLYMWTAQSGLIMNHLKVVIPQIYSVDQGDGLSSPVAWCNHELSSRPRQPLTQSNPEPKNAGP